MIDAKEAKAKTQDKIQSQISKAISLVEKEVEAAIAIGKFATTVQGEELREETVREEVVRHLKVLGYDASFLSGTMPDCFSIKVFWN